MQVGGPNVRDLHCYLRGGSSIPTIQVLDPEGANKEPIIVPYILRGLEKARMINDGTELKENIEIVIAKTLTDVQTLASILPPNMVSIDIECDPKTTSINCIGFAWYSDDNIIKSYTIPFTEGFIRFFKPEEEKQVYEIVANILASARPKLFQNFIFDTMILQRHGFKTNGKIYDTMTLQHLINPEMPKGLADLGRFYLFCEYWKDVKDWKSNELLWQYNARDTSRTLMIHDEQLKTKEMKNADMASLYFDHLVPLHSEVLDMCNHGWIVDTNAIDTVRTLYRTKADNLFKSLSVFAEGKLPNKNIFSLKKGQPKAGCIYARGIGQPLKMIYKTDKKGERKLSASSYARYETFDIPEGTKKLSDLPFPTFSHETEKIDFNPNSAQQVKMLLANRKIRIPLNRKTGQETTDDGALKQLQDKYPNETWLKDILDYRSATKIITTYCDVKLDDDKRLRCTIVVPGTKGGRFSSKGTPWGVGFNSQNMPKEGFRQIVIAPEGHTLLGLDFKQADPHMVAWLSGSEKMIDILNNGDLHCYTASVLYNREITKHDKLERQDGKMCNNGFNYGMRAKTYMHNARRNDRVLTLAEAESHYQAYHTAWPEVKNVWYENVRENLLRNRTLTTPYGRSRLFYGHMGDDYSMAKMMNEALSYVPQSHVADALNRGNLTFLQLCRNKNLRVQWIQQGHDGNIWIVHNEDIVKVKALLVSAYDTTTFYINGILRKFPIDISTGINWAEME